MTDDRSWRRKIWDFLTKAKCTECKKSGGVKTDERLVKASDHIETIVQHESHYDSKNHYTGETRRPVQVTMRTETLDQYYRCDYCGHEWRRRKKYTFQP
jgi:hypothetical protein